MAIQYRKLSQLDKEIRLLEILPQNHEEGHKLIPTCHISYACLTRRPRFVALSYVWGTCQEERMILVDKTPVRVGKNLYDAIMALREPNRSLVIWIDFLCINQGDMREKSWQVELMKDIYRQAMQVYSWLGAADNDSDQVMRYLNEVGEKAEACGIVNGEVGAHTDVWRDLAGLSNITITMEIQDGWHQKDNLFPVEGMKRIFTRPWWGRIWVLQEVALPENAEFICGTQRISRTRCDAAINAYIALKNILAQHFWKDRLSLPSSYQEEITSSLFHLRPNIMLRSWAIYRYGRFCLAALLRLTCVGSTKLHRHGPHHLESTDPRDKIFALLSLASDREELKNKGVSPDYTKNCTEIYASTMATLLELGHMQLLSFCQSPKVQPALPSWVPDWSRSATAMLQDVRSDHITIYPTFSAGGKWCPSDIIVARENGMVESVGVRGRLYDKIEAVGQFPGRTPNEVPLIETYLWPKRWLIEILRLTYRNNEYFLDFHGRLCAAARTSIGGVGYNEDQELLRVRDDARLFDAAILLSGGIRSITEVRFRRDFRQFLAERAVKKKVQETCISETRLGSEIIGKSLGRVPFITVKGHPGLSSQYIQPGDIITLVKGNQVPFILRQQPSGLYQLISEAYVDGIMDGEAAEGTDFQMLGLA